MAIDIIVEDGTQVANANSYVSVADARIYATNRGITLPANDDNVAVMLIKASDYLEAQGDLYKGERVSDTQSLQWPRNCVYVYNALIPSNVIPKQLISAQVQLAMAINAGLDLQPNIKPDAYVIREKVGPIETEYSDPLRIGVKPTFTAANALLSSLFGTGRFTLQTIRV